MGQRHIIVSNHDPNTFELLQGNLYIINKSPRLCLNASSYIKDNVKFVWKE